MRTLERLLTAFLLVGIALLGRGTAQSPPSETFTFAAAADTYVDSSAPVTNFGAASSLRIDGSPLKIAYLRFVVTGVGGRLVEHVGLRLGVTTSTAESGGTIHLVTDNTWSELSVTWANRPAVDGPGLHTLGPINAGTVVEFDLDGAIAGDGTYSLAIDSAFADGIQYSSASASSGQKPELVVTLASGPTVDILQPSDGATFFTADPITFQASAHDETGGDLSTAVSWSSSLQGPLGSGAVITRPLTAGSHTVTAAVTDGTESATDQIGITVTPPPPGNTPPLVTITAPTDGQTFISTEPVTFTGYASDLEDGPLTPGLAWTSDRDGPLGTGGSFTRALGQGTHRITAGVTDRAGSSGAVTVTVQVVAPPTLELTPVADAYVDAGTPATNLGTAPELRMDAGPERITYLRFAVTGIGTRAVTGAILRLQVDSASGAESISGGTIRGVSDNAWQETTVTYATRPAVDGPVVASAGPVTRSQVVDFDVTAAVTRDGTYTFAGVSGSSDGVTYHSRETPTPPKLVLTLGGHAPTVRITAPPDQTAVFTGTPLTLRATANDQEDGDLGAAIHWSSSRDGAFGTGATVITGALSVGTHTLTAAATDSSGFTGRAQETVRIRAPNAAPSVTITAPPNGAATPAGTPVTLTATARDDFDTSLDGQIRWTSNLKGALGTGASITVVLAEGRHTITAAVTDVDGATGSAQITFTVSPTAPVVTITTPPAGSLFVLGTPIALSGTAIDATDGNLSAALRWSSSFGGPIGTGASVTTSALGAGTHTITAAATDSGSLTGQAQLTLTVGANAPPALTITTPADGTILLAGQALRLGATAIDREDGDLSAAIQWRSSRDGVLGTGPSLTVSTLSVGAHTITATVTDRNGASSSASVGVTVRRSTLTFQPVADTYVDASTHPNQTFGSATQLLVSGTPIRQAFLKFAVSGVAPFAVAQARLRLTVGPGTADGSVFGGSVHAVSSNGWFEATTTYKRRPSVDGAALATKGAVAPSQVVEFDVTPAIAGDETQTFAVLSTSSDAVAYRSREAASGRPELLVTLRALNRPSVAITAPATGTVAPQGVPLTFAGSAADIEDGDLSARIAWSSNLDGALGTGPTITVSTLRSGNHTITARVTDSSGNDASATVDVAVGTGIRDFGFGNGVAKQGLEATSMKPESKLWYLDGAWWATLYSPTAHLHRIHRLDPLTQAWVDTGVAVDDRAESRQDVLWDGARLYMASRFGYEASGTDQNRLYRYTYESALKTYFLDAGFPVNLSGGGTESIGIAKDSRGTLWIAYTLNSQVWVNRTLGSDTQWGTPFVPPVAEGTSTDSDDMATVIALPGRIGVFWSNQATDKFYFALHTDGASPTDPAAWKLETPVAGGGVADDHMNLKLASDGRLFAAVKTSYTTSSATLVGLLVRSATGVWSPLHLVATVSANPTRPICLLNEAAHRVYIFYSLDHAAIYFKVSSMDSIAFPSGDGTPFIVGPNVSDVNDPTSTKQNVTAATGLVVEASSNTDASYWHSMMTP